MTAPSGHISASTRAVASTGARAARTACVHPGHQRNGSSAVHVGTSSARTRFRYACADDGGGAPKRHKARLDRAIAADEPHEEIYVAWRCAQANPVDQHGDESGRAPSVRAEGASLSTGPTSEIKRLDMTPKQWRQAFLA